MTQCVIAYVHEPTGGQSLTDVNGKLVDNTATTLKQLRPHLEHIVLQTGEKVRSV